MTRRPGRRAAGPLAAALALVLVSGCSGEETTSNTAEGHSPSPIAVADPPESADWNAADADYLTMMIGHHRQALDMAELARERADDPRVRALARTIDRGQGGEIVVMASWLEEHDLPVPTLEQTQAMAGMGMSGMLDADQMAALADADGADFDELFLSGMTQHHQGAIGMADSVLADGEDVRVNEMATGVVATQSAEIQRMAELAAS